MVPEQSNHSCYHVAPYMRHEVMSFRVAIFRREKVRQQHGHTIAKEHPNDRENGNKKSMILNKKTFGKTDKQGRFGRLCMTTTKGSP